MKRLLNRLKRPFIWCVLYFILGIMGASFDKACPYIILFSTLSIIWISWRLRQKIYLLFTIFLILGQVRTATHPVIQEGSIFTAGSNIELEGFVSKIQETQFGKQITINNVSILKNKEAQSIKSKVLLEYSGDGKVRLNDHIKIVGTIKNPAVKMNPSDMDYLSYLKSQGTTATVKVKKAYLTQRELTLLNRLYDKIIKRIDEIWQGKDKGLIEGMIMGSTDDIPEDITQLYQKTGIAHILAVSGFNIGILMVIVLFVCAELGIPYRARYIISLLIIWIYTFLVGLGVAIVRAAIMATLVIISKCIWEESDDFINLALAAFVILLINPFLLYQVGFLISFFAVASLFCANLIMEKLKSIVAIKHKGLVSAFIYWICVMVGIYPLLAYFFYEIPFLASILNLVIASLFSVIIVLACICLMISVYSIEIARFLGEYIIELLNMINTICESISKMPFATLCTGKPSLITLILIYVFACFMMLYIKGYIKSFKLTLVPVYLFIICSIIRVFGSETLMICHLYIGQGDAAVITTKDKKAILIDGGNIGKGKVIQRYLKYRGIPKLNGVIVSHADADHIGGIIDIVNMDVAIDRVIISAVEDNDLVRTLFEACKKKNIPIYKGWHEDKILMNGIEISYLTPNEESIYLKDSNQKSMVCLIKYKEFEELFTGDIDAEIERKLLSKMKKVDVLKVAHHGSKTSTSDEFIRKTHPKYAILSCGINNLYRHPSQEVMNRLDSYNISTFRTDVLGAITIRTNGNNIIIDYEVKGEQITW